MMECCLTQVMFLNTVLKMIHSMVVWVQTGKCISVDPGDPMPNPELQLLSPSISRENLSQAYIKADSVPLPRQHTGATEGRSRSSSSRSLGLEALLWPAYDLLCLWV